MYAGVPATPFRGTGAAARPSSPGWGGNAQAMPQSMRYTSPNEPSMMFAGLISRWRMRRV